MIKHIAPMAALVVTAGVAFAQQQPSRVYTHPLVPSTDALSRLNLKLNWKTYLPADDSRDGVATVQIMGDRIFVQMRNGSVVAVHGDTGQQIWRMRVGTPYKVTQELGFNFDTVFGVNGSRLFALDRATGRYKWEMNLPNIPTTAPVADSQRVYVCLNGGRLLVFRLPIPEVDAPPPPPDATVPGKPVAPEKPKPPEGAPKSTAPPTGTRVSALGTYYSTESFATTPLTSSSKPPPVTYTPLASASKTGLSLGANYQLNLVWEYTADSRLEFTPIVSLQKPDSPGYLMMPSARGVLYGSAKYQKALVYSFKVESPVAAPLAQYGDTAYLCHEDATVVAMNIEDGKLLWRLAIGGTTRRKPIVTDDDIYLMPDRSGLYRVNRATGEVIWQNKKADRFLSANRKFVYARDARGQLLILDRARGTEVTSYDLRDFTVPIANEYSDRLFLAAHDGLLLCLFDRDYASPVWNKQLLEEKKIEPPKKEGMDKPKDAADK